MTAKSRAALTAQFDVIRNETVAGANTRARIADAHQDALDSVVSVATVSEIRAFGSKGADTYLVLLNGSYVPFAWDATSTATDDGQTCIQVTGVATGRYLQSGIVPTGVQSTISETPIAAGSGEQTLWSYAVPASTDVDVEVALRCSADDGSAGLRLAGSLVCQARRHGSGALAITSQQATVPWTLDNAAWLPQFDVSGNTLRLRLTADSTYTIQPRGTVRRITTDTSGDTEPLLTPAQLLASRASTLLGATLIDQFIEPSYADADVTGWVGSEGHTMTNTVGTHFFAATLGSNNRLALTSTAGLAAQLRADLGAAIRCLIVVAAAPSLPVATYSVLASTGDVGATTTIMMVASNQVLLSANNTIYVDGVQTQTMPAEGGAHIFRIDNAGNSDTAVNVGFSNNPYPWRAAVACVFALSAAPSSGDYTTLAGYINEYLNG